MIFETLIQDMDGKEWAFKGLVVGRGMYDDNGNRSGFVIEGFNIIDIEICDKDIKFLDDVANINQMPDRFSEREIRTLKQEATDAFLQNWMHIQDLASDASYDEFISQKLA